MALQVEQLTESIKQDANTQYAGQYVFSGTATTTAPYEQGEDDEYQGNAETVSRAVGPGATVTITTNISSLLGNGEASEDGKLLDTLRTIAKNMRSGTAEAQERTRRPPTCRTSKANMQALTRAAGDRRERHRPAADRADPQRRPADLDHAGAVEHRRHEHRGGVDRVLERAGRLRGRAARRREHRPGIAAQLPAVDERQGEPHHVRHIREHPFRRRRDRRAGRDRVPVRADRPRRPAATRCSTATRAPASCGCTPSTTPRSRCRS